MSCFKGWWPCMGIIQETTCFLLANIAGLYHGVSGCFPAHFTLINPAQFSGLISGSPKNSDFTNLLFRQEKCNLFMHHAFLCSLFGARHRSEGCGHWAGHSKSRKADVMSCDFYMVTNFYISFQSNMLNFFFSSKKKTFNENISSPVIQ